ncbi:MAG: galactokinase [Firmicutes bacterium]|nr:galactokinase [Bacillota bacterium]
MINTKVLKKQFEDNLHQELLLDLYEDESLMNYQKRRYIAAIDKFEELYGAQEVGVYSAAGRSEVSGNHTDHQHGCVLAASINLDAIAIVAPQEDVIKVVSDNYDIKPISINDLAKKDEEEGTSEGLIRGVVAKLQEMGYKVGGFKAFITSDVLMGAGLSSSAAFETIIGTIIDGLYNDMAIDMVTIAKVGQFAENVYFGKPCGLMDQCACAVGGLISIDFNDTSKPIVNHVDVDFGKYNHSLCIVDTKGSHADLTDEYAAVPAEMKKVAAFFGKEVLRDVPAEEFFENIAKARAACGDRAVLRAIHFFNENERVGKIVAALNSDDFDTFKALIQESGNSSYKFLQNVFAACDPQNQAVSIGLAMSEILLDGHGVCRVHGGGFAGTIQAFVENEHVEVYKDGIEKVFGLGSCHVLKVRKYGGYKVLE